MKALSAFTWTGRGHTMKIRHALLASALALATSLPATAATVRLTAFTYNPATTVTVGAPNYSGRAGQFVGTLDDQAFQTFCMDLLQDFSFNTTYTYSVVDGVTAWGATRSSAIDKVFSYAIANNLPSDAATSATVQSALWEVLYETNPGYGFASGAFRVSSSGPTQSALNAWNWNAVLSTPVTHRASQLFHPSRQDFVVVSRVPEPASVAMLGLGLLGVLSLARVRTRRPRRAPAQG
jgi:hypothetical protein